MNKCIARLKIYNLSELQSKHSQSRGGGHNLLSPLLKTQGTINVVKTYKAEYNNIKKRQLQ